MDIQHFIFAWILSMSFLFRGVHSVTVNIKITSFSPQSSIVIPVDCDGKADISTIKIVYKLKDTVIYESDKPDTHESYIVDYKDGTVGFKVNGVTDGFEDISCERDGVQSLNKITIFAISEMELKRDPKKFKIDSPIEMECSFKIRPAAHYGYIGWLQHQGAGAKEPTSFAKIDYIDDDPNKKGTYLDTDVKDIMKVVPSTDKSKFAATVTPLNDKARGRYTCLVGLGGNAYVIDPWETNNSGSFSKASIICISILAVFSLLLFQ